MDNIWRVMDKMNELEKEMAKLNDKAYDKCQAGNIKSSNYYEKEAEKIKIEIQGMASCLRMLGINAKREEDSADYIGHWYIPKKVHELRVRYEVPEMFGGKPAVVGVVCDYPKAKEWLDKIREAGYKLVGLDDRYRDENERFELDEGWSEVITGDPFEATEKKYSERTQQKNEMEVH